MYALPHKPIHWFSRTTSFKPEEKKSQRQSFPLEENKFIAGHENDEKFR
jgi:hypothetical protein